MFSHRSALNIFLTGLIFCLFTPGIAEAQISSSTADHADSLSYSTKAGKDPLFVFYQSNQVPKTGTLSATLPGSDSYDFEWNRYNPATGLFDIKVGEDTNKQSSSISGLEDGGYLVSISDGVAVDTFMLAWVMLDHFRAEAEQTPDGLVKPNKYYCGFLVISGSVTPDTMVYYDPLSRDTLYLPVNYRFKWTSDNDDLRIPNDSTVLDPNITYLPPVKDTWYILTATDNMGMVDVDSVLYESIETTAEFTVEYLDKVTGEYDAELTGSWSKDKGSLDAMLTVRFNNLSENGASFEWVYLDTVGGIKQNETTYNVEDVVEFTYETADEYYYPFLVSVSEEGCIDTFRLEQGIFVVPSQLLIPNVFSPNGDGMNDLFVFKHQSLKSCKITIVDRTGKVVYKREIDNIYDWDGWDGNIRESDRSAPQGQYYYVVEATGYDGIEYKDLNIIENWKLNRSNKNNQTGGTSTSGGQEPDTQSNNLYTGWLYLYRTTGEY